MAEFYKSRTVYINKENSDIGKHFQENYIGNAEDILPELFKNLG